MQLTNLSLTHRHANLTYLTNIALSHTVAASALKNLENFQLANSEEAKSIAKVVVKGKSNPYQLVYAVPYFAHEVFARQKPEGSQTVQETTTSDGDGFPCCPLSSENKQLKICDRPVHLVRLEHVDAVENTQDPESVLQATNLLKNLVGSHIMGQGTTSSGSDIVAVVKKKIKYPNISLAEKEIAALKPDPVIVNGDT